MTNISYVNWPWSLSYTISIGAGDERKVMSSRTHRDDLMSSYCLVHKPEKNHVMWLKEHFFSSAHTHIRNHSAEHQSMRRYFLHNDIKKNKEEIQKTLSRITDCAFKSNNTIIVIKFEPVHCRWSCTWRGVCLCSQPSPTESQLAPLSLASVSLKTTHPI